MLLGDVIARARQPLEQGAVHEAPRPLLVASKDRLDGVRAGLVTHTPRRPRHAKGELPHGRAGVLRQPGGGQSRDRLGLDPAQIDLPRLVLRGCPDLARQVAPFGEALAHQALQLGDQRVPDVVGLAVQGRLDLVQTHVEAAVPKLVLEDDREMPRRWLVVAELPGPREVHHRVSRHEGPVLEVGSDVLLLLLPALASLCCRANPVRREEGQQLLLHLAAGEGLSPSEDILERVDLKLNAAPGQPLGEHHGEGPA